MERFLAALIVIVATMVAVSRAYPGSHCTDHPQCGEGKACLQPGNNQNSANGQLKCYYCDCAENSQCRAPSGNPTQNNATCNCTEAHYYPHVVETCHPTCEAEPCDQHATCADGEFGQAVCTCKAGWTGDGFTCIDIDECSEDSNRCGEFSCANEDGGYCCTQTSSTSK